MIKENKTTFKQFIISFFLSVFCGSLTGIVVFLFKYAAYYVADFSSELYQFVRENQIYLLVLLFAVAVLSLILYFIVKYDAFCKGGGISTSITIIRDSLPFRWFSSVFLLPLAALITFFSGVPLGTEGPSVQIGCAIGKSTLNFAKKDSEKLSSHIESGGMGAGFASVTGAPFTALVFVFEELRLGFSPLMMVSVLSAVASSTLVSNILGHILNFHTKLFDITANEFLSFKFIWLVFFLGIIVGIFALLFIKLFHFAERLLDCKLKKIPVCLKFLFLFIVTAILGFFSSDFIGTGYSLINEIFTKIQNIWYMMLLALVVRAVLAAFSNKAGITGGLFIPTLALGAIFGYLFSEVFILLGVLPEKYAMIIILISVCSFLAAATKIPFTASVFALEIFGVGYNIVYVCVAIAFAFLVVKIFDVEKHVSINIKHKI